MAGLIWRAIPRRASPSARQDSPGSSGHARRSRGPRAWYVRGTYATEQYLLQAFLIGNRDYEVLFAAHAVARAHRAELEDVIPSLRERPDHHPAALWLRRRAEEGGSRRGGGRRP